MTTIGDLCAGYGGLGMAAEQVTGGRTVWHVENDAAPASILAHHYPEVRNFGDIKSLEWAAHPVDVLTAGYPCQPFSGAGKRLGTADPRHLFPWIVQGVERMRPSLLLLENVRGHLTLGFDLVLAELDRIGYDVRWTLLPASAIGGCHRRSRLWIAARAREAGGWPMPVGEPTALAESGEWVDPASGLFGSIEAQRPGTAGVVVRGRRWDGDATVVVLPSQRAACPQCGHDWSMHLSGYGCPCGCGEEWAPDLLPTPRSTDSNGAGAHGDGGPDLRTAVNLLPTPRATRGGSHSETRDLLLPTPRARDGKGCDPNPRGVDLNQAVALLPTPEASDATGGRVSAEKGGRRDSGAKRAVTLATAVDPRHLLPTPTALDYGSYQSASNGAAVRPSLSQLARGDALLSTPVAADGGGARASSAGWGLRDESRLIAESWGIYAAAIHRHEASFGREAPLPTEQGRNGPRLSPRFVEWMQGLPDGWVTGVPGITRNHALKALGNGVVPDQAVAAYRLLGVSDLFAEAAA